MSRSISLLAAFESYLVRANEINSAVLFGSSANIEAETAVADGWSDFDIHIASSNVSRSEEIDWISALPDQGFRFQVIRPASANVRKTTVFFSTGQLDLIIVPLQKLKLAKWGLQFGLYPRVLPLRVGLDEIHTCLRSGYRFLKGEKKWKQFYLRVYRDVRGVRMDDREALQRANVAAADFLWILQKIRRGELSAAQRHLHCSLGDTNFSLLREQRLRSGMALPSFGLARRVESVLTAEELKWIRIDARLDSHDLESAAWNAFDGCQSLMRRLIPQWRLPNEMISLLQSYKKR